MVPSISCCGHPRRNAASWCFCAASGRAGARCRARETSPSTPRAGLRAGLVHGQQRRFDLVGRSPRRSPRPCQQRDRDSTPRRTPAKRPGQGDASRDRRGEFHPSRSPRDERHRPERRRARPPHRLPCPPAHNWSLRPWTVRVAGVVPDDPAPSGEEPIREPRGIDVGRIPRGQGLAAQAVHPPPTPTRDLRRRASLSSRHKSQI
jgi:hypothetical protein